MANTYTELIDSLRGLAQDERDFAKSRGIETETQFAKVVSGAADAIETLSKGINAYSDEAFKRAQELSYARERIDELEEEKITIENRLSHLLRSKTISEYDAKRTVDGEYVYPIGTLDQRMRELLEIEKKYCDLTAERAPDPAPAPSPAILYICDRRACDRCNPECKHTTDIRHAYHFEVGQFGGFAESEY